MIEKRTAVFNGHSYNFLAYDQVSILEQPGVKNLSGVAASPEGAANSTWWTFQDEAEVRDRHWYFNPGDVVFDIGAAFGSYAITAAVQGARVLAFEPCEFCRSILTANVNANPEISSLIKIIPIGIHEQSGYFEPNDNLFSTDPVFSSLETLQVRSIDDIMTEYSDIDHIEMIKLDVEGAELGVLQGAEQALHRFKPRLLIEEHEFKLAGIGKQCQDFIRSLGFKYEYERHPHGSVSHTCYEFSHEN